MDLQVGNEEEIHIYLRTQLTESQWISGNSSFT